MTARLGWIIGSVYATSQSCFLYFRLLPVVCKPAYGVYSPDRFTCSRPEHTLICIRVYSSLATPEHVLHVIHFWIIVLKNTLKAQYCQAKQSISTMRKDELASLQANFFDCMRSEETQ